MKKHLLTRFLLPLVIGTGSPFSAWSKVAESPPRQEGAIPSDLPGMVYLEVSDYPGLDSLSVRFWDRLLSERMNVTPGIPNQIAGLEGNMFEGSRNFRVFTVPLSPAQSHGFFTLNAGKNRLIRQWIYFPQDRVRIRADLSSGTLLFGGPDADFYQAQYELDRVFKEQQFNTDPILFSANPEFYRSDSLSERLWIQSREKPRDLFVQMKVLSEAEEAWKEAEKYMDSDWQKHPAMEILKRYKAILTPDRIRILEASLIGQILFTGINKADLAWTAILQDPSKMEKLRAYFQSFDLKSQEYSHPLLVQATFQFSLMEAYASQKPIEQVFATLSNPLREEVIGFYLLDNFNRMGNRLPEIISKNMALVQSDWIIQRLDKLLAMSGNKFIPEGIQLSDGSPLNGNRIMDKTLLIHFWITGCRFCMEEHERVMAELSERYKGREDVLILTINADAKRETWIQGLSTGKYTSAHSLNAWVPQGTGILKTYSVYSFPQKMIINKNGTLQLQTINRMELEELVFRLENNTNPPNRSTQINP